MSSAAKTADVRFVGPVMGRYALESRMRTSGVQIFACRLQSISTTRVVASAPVPGLLDENVTINFEPFGTLRGQIVRHVEGGFGMEIEADADEREKLASKIDWYKKRTFAGLTDKRRHRRFMPRDPRSALVLASGHVLPCLIIDMSASGAAVSADVDPPIGEPLAIGRAVARVVRRLEVGFAVRFLSEFELETVGGRAQGSRRMGAGDRRATGRRGGRPSSAVRGAGQRGRWGARSDRRGLQHLSQSKRAPTGLFACSRTPILDQAE